MERYLHRIPNTSNRIHYEITAFRTFDKVVLVLLCFYLKVLNFPNMQPEDRVDPMSRIFPRMTKCIFHKYGGSGTIQRFDALCVLSMNIVNEKIYIFLWFWYIILAIITGIGLMVRIGYFFLPNFRTRYVYGTSKTLSNDVNTFFRLICAHLIPK